MRVTLFDLPVDILSYEPLDSLIQVSVGPVTIRLGPEALAGLRGEAV